MARKKHVFVIGLTDFHRERLARIEGAEELELHPLLDKSQIVPSVEGFSFDGTLDAARDVLERAEHRPDAIVGYWDFPTSCLRPILCRDFGLPTASLESVLRCEHKGWSRIEQRRVLPTTPAFDLIDPFAEDPLADVTLDFPFWLKPVKAFQSYLGFKVRDADHLRECLERFRAEIGGLARPFDECLAHADLPEEIQGIGGRYCIAEELIDSDHQCTIEGFVRDGEARVHGVVDSLATPGTSSFDRYQYPSRLPQLVQDRMRDASRRVMRQIGYEHGAFNIEFFYHSATDRLSLLEINTRISQSHVNVFLAVDGAPNFQVPVRLALGEDPAFPRRQGEYAVAAKVFFRRFEDGVVRRVPSEDDLRRIEREIPGVSIPTPQVREGMRLADLPHQDSYSYVVAELHVAAMTEEQLLDKYNRALAALDFRFEPVS